MTGTANLEDGAKEKEAARYTHIFHKEHNDALIEVVRLTYLFRDVCWYHFETQCREWKYPWPRTIPHTRCELQGMRFTRRYNRGVQVEFGKFPIYYSGRVDEAPPCPPVIVLRELEEAQAYAKYCEKQCSAAYDWAPGGAEYEKLCAQWPSHFSS